MKLLGENITDLPVFDIKLMKKLCDEGKKMLKFNPNQVNPTEKGLIIAADYALQLEKYTKNLKKPSSVIYHPSNIAIAAAADYYVGKKAVEDLKYIKRTMVDKVASAAFFLMWDTLNGDFYQEYGEDTDKWKYHTEMCIDYGFEMITGGEHFRKIGIRVVNSKDSNDVEYFDALKIAKDFVDNDLIDMGETCTADQDDFIYLFNVALGRAKREKWDDLKKPEPILKKIEKLIDQKKNEEK